MDWKRWRNHFELNARRPLPEVEPGAPELPDAWRGPLSDSLARFQIGEAGEGRIAHQIDRVHFASIDDDYRQALKRFVAEEGRHARILALLVKALGGRLLQHTWTERLFVIGRRLVGVRLKLLVLLAAEVVGIGYYGAACERLPAGTLRDALRQICEDEQQHLEFHADFFKAECPSWWKRALFRATWWAVCLLASVLVLHDHRAALRAMGLGRVELMRRFIALTRQVDVAVLSAPSQAVAHPATAK